MTFTVPGYRLQRRLGQGSQGEVWLAEQAATGDRVALKWLPLSTPGADAVARSEAALLARLDHPSLIALREFRICDDGCVLVLELAEAGSLANLLRRRDKLTPAEVVATVSPIAAALAHAHNAGVLHGDVSPANILFSVTGHPKLADLGVARLVAGIGAGPGLGTPAYLDPAIAAGGASSLPSDVFSLAAVTLHALTGAGPWPVAGIEIPSAEQVLSLAATGRIVDLERRLAPLPPAMASALTRALDRDPNRRGTAAEFALDMRAALPPSPVVLAGGRITGSVGRHSTEHRSQSHPGPDRPRSFLVADGSGPEFVPADLTRVSRPLIRTLPKPEPEPEPAGLIRRFVEHMTGQSRRQAAVVVGLVGMLVAAGVLGWPLLRQRAAMVGADPRPVAAHPSPAASPGRQASTSVPGRGTAAAVLARLNQLDAVRAEAFGQRRPELLSQVYDSQSLLAADIATLAATVPEGCTLPGLHTTYADLVVVAASTSNVRVRVTATLAAASRQCSGQAPARTAAIGPQTLLIALSGPPASTGVSGMRIASQSTA